MWNAGALLDTIQELLGEPVGGFYNITRRLAHLSQAQNEMVVETSAIQEDGQLDVEPGRAEYWLPGLFVRFGDRQPYLGDSALEVVPPRALDMMYPAWRSGKDKGTPQYIVQEGRAVFLYPTPNDAGTLHYNYIPYVTPILELEQLPFNERMDLNRFAPALAYKVAATLVAPRSPQLAQMYEGMYVGEEKKMRHFVRSNAQKPQSIYPTTRWGRHAARD